MSDHHTSHGGCGATKKQTSRQLRERKQKLYSEDWALDDDDDDEEEIEVGGHRSFDIQQKLEDPAFEVHQVVREMHGNELTVAYFQRYGFNKPLLFKEKHGLGLRVPPNTFTVNDVRSCVGSKRMVDVMDVSTQKNSEMSMRDWQRYYEEEGNNGTRTRLLNVISLEFSHTRLEQFVQSPTVVRQVDWVECVWPRHMRHSQVDGTNVLDVMKYPKVRKYCLMSVKGCYTDFRVDFGGTSVWYHILKGCKVFWLIPPTDENLELYEKWLLSGKQSGIFFGDTVEKCTRITLTAGNTFFIPTGWIHAVYTSMDSLVFGGNFLHSYAIEKQLKIARIEDTTKVQQKYRYPFFSEMLWYVLERYVFCFLGQSHLTYGSSYDPPADAPHVHLTPAELHGLGAIVLYLHMLPSHKKNIPQSIRNPAPLIHDISKLIGLHRFDSPSKAVTGRIALYPSNDPNALSNTMNNATGANAIITNANAASTFNGTSVSPSLGTGKSSAAVSGHWNGTKPSSGHSTSGPPLLNLAQTAVINGKTVLKTPVITACSIASVGGSIGVGGISSGDSVKSSSSGNSSSGPRRRRTRCKRCDACQRSDCGQCSFCLDMVKFGGTGRAKQTCSMRQCLQPMLPVTAACVHCGLDGWNQTPVLPLVKAPQRCDSASNLMECSVCYEIAHPACVQRFCPETSGYINEDMPNSWECPQCCKLGKNNDYRPRHFRARQKSTDMRRMSTTSTDSQLAHLNTDGAIQQRLSSENIVKSEPDIHTTNVTSQESGHTISVTTLTCKSDLLPIKKRRSSGGADSISSDTSNTSNATASHTTATTSQTLPQQKQLLLPPPPSPSPSATSTSTTSSSNKPPTTLSNSSTSASTTSTVSSNSANGNESSNRKSAFRMHLAQQIAHNSSKILKRPTVVVRPANTNVYQPPPGLASGGQLVYDKQCLLAVFRYLNARDLFNCMLVCKTWAAYTVDPSLWRLMAFERRHVSSAMLKGIVRRQPELLHLDWCQLSRFQLPWLLQRLVRLRELSLVSVPVKTATALRTTQPHHLQMLDLSFVSELNDAALRDILGPVQGQESVPHGSTATTATTSEVRWCRFRNLRHLKLAGTDITDISMRYIVQYVPHVQHLCLSLCARLSDAGIAQLATKPAKTVQNLLSLDVSHAKLITEVSLDHLVRCEQLVRLDCRHAPQISTQALIKFAAKSDRDLQVRDIKLVDKRIHGTTST